MTPLLDREKRSHFRDRVQVIHFAASGRLLESCQTLLRLEEGADLYDEILFLEGVRDEIEALEPGQRLDFGLAGLRLGGQEGHYSLSIRKLKPEEAEGFLLVIEDKSEEGKLMTEVQQRRNEAILQQDKIAAQLVQIKKQNHTLGAMLQALRNARVSRKALAISFVIVLILFLLSEGLIEPIIDDWSSSFWLGLGIKFLIAMSFKPIENLVSSFLKRRAIRIAGPDDVSEAENWLSPEDYQWWEKLSEKPKRFRS